MSCCIHGFVNFLIFVAGLSLVVSCVILNFKYLIGEYVLANLDIHQTIIDYIRRMSPSDEFAIFLNYIQESTDSELHTYLLESWVIVLRIGIAIGSLLILVSFIRACCSKCSKWCSSKCYCSSFIAFLVILLLTEVVLCLLVYLGTDQAKYDLGTILNLTQSIAEHNGSSTECAMYNSMNQAHVCCGYHGFGISEVCLNATQCLTDEACNDVLWNNLEHSFTTVGKCTVFVMAVELFAMLYSCSKCGTASSSRSPNRKVFKQTKKPSNGTKLTRWNGEDCDGKLFEQTRVAGGTHLRRYDF